MAINTLVQQLCREEEVGFVDLWGCFVRTADMFMRDGLHLVEMVEQSTIAWVVSTIFFLANIV